MNTLQRTLPAAVGLLALASIAATPSCGSKTVKECDTRITQPARVVPFEGGKVVQAVTTSVCDHAVSSYHVHLAIWYRRTAAQAWRNVTVATSPECDAPPSPGYKPRCEAHTLCSIGDYETRANLTGHNELGAFAFTLPERPVTHVKHC